MRHCFKANSTIRHIHIVPVKCRGHLQKKLNRSKYEVKIVLMCLF